MDFKGFPGLAGKTAIVTGSTQGLGADIARGLAAAGANVVLVGRNAPAGQALADELRERALYCETDIGQDAQIERCIQAALATFGRIDILVNNACQYADQGLASSREQWHATLDTNLVSAAIFTQLVAPRLRARRGGEHGQHRRQVRRGRTRDLSGVQGGLAADHQELRGGTGAGRRAGAGGVAGLDLVAFGRTTGGRFARGGRRRGRAFPSARAGGIGRGDRGGGVFRVLGRGVVDDGVDIPVDGGFSVLGPDRGFPARVVPRAGAGPGRRADGA